MHLYKVETTVIYWAFACILGGSHFCRTAAGEKNDGRIAKTSSRHEVRYTAPCVGPAERGLVLFLAHWAASTPCSVPFR